MLFFWKDCCNCLGGFLCDKKVVMVESTHRNPHLLVGEYSNPAVKLRPGEKDVVLIAAAQPIDFTFPNWVQRSQLNKSEFQPYDSNFPLKIPRRDFFKAAHSVDAPLSQFGQHISRVIGRQLVDYKFRPSAIYSCPSLKCLETSSLIVNSYKTNPQICVEPGLWGEFSSIDSGLLISTEDAKKLNGFPIKRQYEEQIPLNIVDKCPNWKEWQKRCIKTFKTILLKEKGHAIFVLDQLSMKTITTFCLYGENFGFHSDEDFLNLSSIPHGSCLLFERKIEGALELAENFFPNYTTSTFSTKFNFDKLDEEVAVSAP